MGRIADVSVRNDFALMPLAWFKLLIAWIDYSKFPASLIKVCMQMLMNLDALSQYEFVLTPAGQCFKQFPDFDVESNRSK